MKVLLICFNRPKVRYPVFPKGLDDVVGAVAPPPARILDDQLRPVGESGERFARLQWCQDERGNLGPLRERLN